MQIVGLHSLIAIRTPLTVTTDEWRRLKEIFLQLRGFIDFSLINNNYCSHGAIYLQKNNIKKPYTKPIHTVLGNRHKQLPKNSTHKYTNATAFSNAEIRFIRPADETMRTANPVRYFANRTWHACDVTSNQRPSSHVSSHITGSPVHSSQFANYQTPVKPPTVLFSVPERRKIVLGKYNWPCPGTDIQCVLTLFSVLEGRTVEILPHYFPSLRDGQ